MRKLLHLVQPTFTEELGAAGTGFERYEDEMKSKYSPFRNLDICLEPESLTLEKLRLLSL